MPEFINGPTNYVYLKGTINDVEKDIYLFMDYHYSLDEQTRCESFDSIDISQYLYKLIKNTSIPLDFFIEIRTGHIKQPLTTKRDIYIKDVIEMFKHEFVVEKINDKDIVKYSKSNPNVRLHYLDIRDHFDIFYILDIIKYDITENLNLLIKNGYNKEYINKILYKLKIIKHILNVLRKNKNEVIFNKQESYDKYSQLYYINKIINKYDDNMLKEKMFEFINTHYSHIIMSLIAYIEEIYPYINSYDKKYNENIKEKINNIRDLSVDLYSLFVDAYLLRRILDKKYINNCIVYTGAQHSVNYMFFLIKYCNFKLIYIHNSEEKDLDKLKELIKNAKYVYEIYELIYLKKKYIQCIKNISFFNDSKYMGDHILD
jgi:hypothetical protein